MKKNLGQKTLIRKDAGSLVQQQQIKNQITVLPELEQLIPPLLADEFNQLESNIRSEGCREPLIVWSTTADKIGLEDTGDPLFVLIDGHNRYGICQRNHIDYKISVREYNSLDEVRDFMINNQLGRRNLSPSQLAYLRGLKYLSTKNEIGRQTKTDQVTVSVDSLSNSGSKTNKTDEILAKEFKVSPKTIRLDASFAKGVNRLSEPLKKDVLAGVVKLNKGDIIKLGDSTNPEIEPIGTIEEFKKQTKDKTQVPSSHNSPKLKPGPTPKVTDDISIENELSEIQKISSRLQVSSDHLISDCEDLIKRLRNFIDVVNKY